MVIGNNTCQRIRSPLGRLGIYLPLILLALMSAIHWNTSFAYQVDNLFNAEVDVYDRGIEQRREGTRRALEKVLVKVSGIRDLDVISGLIPSDKNIERFVEQFRYEEIELAPVVPDMMNTPTNPLQDTTSEEDGLAHLSLETEPQNMAKLRLWVAFDSNAVLRLLQQANLPVWDQTRTLSLLWLALQTGSQRYLIEPERHKEVKAIIDDVAASRGLPIVFPLMDLEDQSVLALSDVWGDFADTVKLASKRYRPDSIIVGRVFEESGGFWSARWTLYQGEDVYRWENRADSKEAVIAEGINATADIFARLYSQVLLDNLEPPLALTLLGIRNFDQYAKAVNYLESLTQVASLTITRIHEDQVDFNLTIRGRKEGLERVVELGGVLTRVTLEPTEPTEHVTQFDELGMSTEPVKRRMVYQLRQ